LTVFRRAPFGRDTWLGVLAATSTLLGACSGSPASTTTGPVGTSIGVALNSATGTTLVQQGAQLNLSATVTSDPTNAGVSWLLTGAGTLSNQTKTSVTYTAPTGITGSISPILTATSIADNTKTATALLLVQGTPVINPTDLFPANVGSPYTAQITVSGGLDPFTWILSGGALPPGVTLAAGTTSLTTLTGTPTTAGTYSFQVKVTDHNNKVATVDLSLVVKPTAACLLEGQYASVYTGYVGGQVAVGGTSMTISSAGTISGFHDFNPGGTTISESVTGTCATRLANNGTTQLVGVANSPVFNYAMTAPLLKGRVQLINGGSSQSGSGPLEKQTPTDFVLAKLAGNFAFGALGAQSGGARTGTVGAITIDPSGRVISGHADSNGAGPLTDATLTGTVTAPSATTGRGTLTLTASGAGGSRTMHFAYYIVTADRLFIASTDSSLPISGYMTRQVGPFSNSSLSNPGILTLWGGAAVYQPSTVLALGRLSAADPGSGTVNLLLDATYQSTITFGQTFNGGIYAVRAADGRTTMTFTAGATTHEFVVYLDGPSSGYVVEPGSSVGSSGLLEAQSTGPFDLTMPGLYVSGTQFPEDASPIVLLPAVYFSTGSYSGGSIARGIYALDSNTGRGVGTLNISGFPISPLALYILRPDKVITLQMGTQYSNGTISWMTSD
jgi:hypothetical protein